MVRKTLALAFFCDSANQPVIEITVCQHWRRILYGFGLSYENWSARNKLVYTSSERFIGKEIEKMVFAWESSSLEITKILYPKIEMEFELRVIKLEKSTEKKFKRNSRNKKVVSDVKSM